MAFNQEAFLAALEQARSALDEIEVAAAAQKPAEDEPPEMEEPGEGAPPMPPGMMGKKPMMEE